MTTTYLWLYVFVCLHVCVYCTAHYMHVCLWCKCLTILHRLRSRKAAQLHIPLKNLALRHRGDFNPQNRTLAHIHTHFCKTPTRSAICTSKIAFAQMRTHTSPTHDGLTHTRTRTHAQGRGLCIIAGTLPAYMSLIRLRSRERARIKPSLIRNRVYRLHTIGGTMRLVYTTLHKFRYLLSPYTYTVQ